MHNTHSSILHAENPEKEYLPVKMVMKGFRITKMSIMVYGSEDNMTHEDTDIQNVQVTIPSTIEIAAMTDVLVTASVNCESHEENFEGMLIFTRISH